MPEKKPPVIKIPQGVGANGPIEDIDDAVKQALISVPFLLSEMIDRFESIAASLEWIEDYVKRRGRDEGVFSPEELEEKDNEEEGEEDGTVG